MVKKKRPGPKKKTGPKRKMAWARVHKIACEGVASGSTLLQIERAHKKDGFPAVNNYLQWVADHPQKSSEYARSRRLQLEQFFDRILDEVMAPARLYLMPTKHGVIERVDQADIQLRKLRVEAMQWFLARLQRKQYGAPGEVEAGQWIAAIHQAVLASAEGQVVDMDRVKADLIAQAISHEGAHDAGGGEA